MARTDDTFAKMPPIEAIRMALSRAVTRKKGMKGLSSRKIAFIDAEKAHFNPPCREDVYI